MEVENKLKAMGLEPPAAPPPLGRAGVEQGCVGARPARLNCRAEVKAVIGGWDKEESVADLIFQCRTTPGPFPT